MKALVFSGKISILSYTSGKRKKMFVLCILNLVQLDSA